MPLPFCFRYLDRSLRKVCHLCDLQCVVYTLFRSISMARFASFKSPSIGFRRTKFEMFRRWIKITLTTENHKLAVMLRAPVGGRKRQWRNPWQSTLFSPKSSADSSSSTVHSVQIFQLALAGGKSCRTAHWYFSLATFRIAPQLTKHPLLPKIYFEQLCGFIIARNFPGGGGGT